MFAAHLTNPSGMGGKYFSGLPPSALKPLAASPYSKEKVMPGGKTSITSSSIRWSSGQRPQVQVPGGPNTCAIDAPSRPGAVMTVTCSSAGQCMTAWAAS